VKSRIVTVIKQALTRKVLIKNEQAEAVNDKKARVKKEGKRYTGQRGKIWELPLSIAWLWLLMPA